MQDAEDTSSEMLILWRQIANDLREIKEHVVRPSQSTDHAEFVDPAIAQAITLLGTAGAEIRTRGMVSTRKVAKLVNMSHHTLGRNELWQKSLERLEGIEGAGRTVRRGFNDGDGQIDGVD